MCENLDFVQNFRKAPFWSKFQKWRFWSKFAKKKLILVEIFENLDFGRNLPNISRFWSKVAKNLDFGQILRKSHSSGNVLKSRFWSTFCENLDFSRHFATNLGFGRNILNISIWVVICEKSRFWSNFAKISF